ncbi:MAG: hypothetical protein EBU46_15170, partial [Nitrosomonadaceae bacterium]|nr:hypothetical protein [Nitrosomonadaceae bacterium]
SRNDGGEHDQSQYDGNNQSQTNSMSDPNGRIMIDRFSDFRVTCGICLRLELKIIAIIFLTQEGTKVTNCHSGNLSHLPRTGSELLFG